MVRVAAFVACGFILSGCSSALPSMDFFKSSPATEALRIESQPPGAEAKTASGQSCRTPCELKVQPGTDSSVTLAMTGYKTQTVSLRTGEGEEAKIGPNPVYAELEKDAPAAAKKKKTAAVKKPKPTTTASVATPTTTASVPAPAPAEPAAAEPAPAFGGPSYPWSTGR